MTKWKAAFEMFPNEDYLGVFEEKLWHIAQTLKSIWLQSPKYNQIDHITV